MKKITINTPAGLRDELFEVLKASGIRFEIQTYYGEVSDVLTLYGESAAAPSKKSLLERQTEATEKIADTWTYVDKLKFDNAKRIDDLEWKVSTLIAEHFSK